MHIWRSIDEVPADLGRTAVVIGNFDGVHLGHRHVLTRAREVADERDLTLVAVTFDPHPMAVLRPEHAPSSLTSSRRAPSCWATAARTRCSCCRFDRDMASWTPEEFVERVLVTTLHAAAVVVGANFRFGNRAAGDVATLRETGAVHDFEAEGIALDGGPQVWFLDVRPHLPGHRGRRGPPRPSAGRTPCTARSCRATAAAVSSATRPANVPTSTMTAAPADGVYAGWAAAYRHRRAPPPRPSASGPTPRSTASASAASRATCWTAPTSSSTAWTWEVSFVDRLRGMVAFASVESWSSR
nr:adenylyltransferase/cytidyltransferase family protein [Nocardioides ungokensis]